MGSSVFLTGACLGQTQTPEIDAPSPASPTSVNWLYGAYIPKDAPLESLTSHQRLKLYVRQAFTTPGIYIKTVALAADDQRRGFPDTWTQDFTGFSKRVGTEYTKALIQTSITATGDGIAGWEPRYDRCRCNGIWNRSRHAIARNVVTYDRSEKNLRPQVMPYLGAFSAAAASASWELDRPNYFVRGYQGAFTQLWLGSLTNLAGEFLPDIARKLKLTNR